MNSGRRRFSAPAQEADLGWKTSTTAYKGRGRQRFALTQASHA